LRLPQAVFEAWASCYEPEQLNNNFQSAGVSTCQQQQPLLRWKFQNNI